MFSLSRLRISSASRAPAMPYPTTTIFLVTLPPRPLRGTAAPDGSLRKLRSLLRRLRSSGALRGLGGSLIVDGSLRKLRSRCLQPHGTDLELGHPAGRVQYRVGEQVRPARTGKVKRQEHEVDANRGHTTDTRPHGAAPGHDVGEVTVGQTGAGGGVRVHLDVRLGCGRHQ